MRAGAVMIYAAGNLWSAAVVAGGSWCHLLRLLLKHLDETKTKIKN